VSPILNNVSRRKIKVTIFATYPLVRQSLQLLINEDRELTVLDVVATTSELVEKVSHRSPDVVLLCLLDNEGKYIEVLSDLRKIVPQIKTVVLSSPNSSIDHPAALKLGVTGIVGTNQNARVLIRAVRQVSEGEVWLNQKLLTQLLNHNFESASGGGTTKRKGFYTDDLTVRELEVVGMIGLGMNNKEISRQLYISEATVRHHLSSIYGKLNVEDRLNLAIYAHRRQIVPPAPTSSI
jgi:two-component system, NarL family, response regulator DegU